MAVRRIRHRCECSRKIERMGGLTFARDSKAVQCSSPLGQETQHLHRPAPLETVITPSEDNYTGTIGGIQDGVVVGRANWISRPKQIGRRCSSPRE